MKTYNWKITFKCYDDECVCGELTPKNITLKVDIIFKKNCHHWLYRFYTVLESMPLILCYVCVM